MARKGKLFLDPQPAPHGGERMRTKVGATVIGVMVVGILSGCQASYEAEARSKAAAQNAESAATRAEAAARRAEQAVSKAEAAAQRAEAAVAKMEPAPTHGRHRK
jgi:hypothetical protein